MTSSSGSFSIGLFVKTLHFRTFNVEVSENDVALSVTLGLGLLKWLNALDELNVRF